MSAIRVEDLHQVYGAYHALRGVSLEVREGEFFGLLGPSGSGKTTLLRLLAGFEPSSRGKIWIGDREVTHLPPEKRRIGMVFQNYALFPHLSVGANVAYGLKTIRVPKAEIPGRVADALALVELDGFEPRDVHSLSGGQQQRVALARALAPHPKVLLMDEPLSNLDARLRLQTRLEIRELQRRLGMTTLYVTHDKAEAFSLSDRVAVLLDGELHQVNPPEALYRSPATLRVAEFLGEMNLIPVMVEEVRDGATATIRFLGQQVELKVGVSASWKPGESALAAFRPEATGPEGMFSLAGEGTVRGVSYEGERWRLSVDSGKASLTLAWPWPWLRVPLASGSPLRFSVSSEDMVLFRP
ncbi:MAG: ABC transporter ATP-binding protein [Candidatus Omnitrophica bacterium]|nr:ABC transporter ATP-binding protein [Candidatus Omnitrophota bacterium]